MNILCVDPEVACLDFLLRASASGHKCRWFKATTKQTFEGVGFKQIEIVSDYRDSLKWAKSGLILVTGNTKFIAEMDRLRDFGFPIFAPSQKSAALEINRAAGMEVLEKLGIDVPHYETFTSLADAAKFARKADQGYVFKCMGSEEDKSLTYVSCDPGDLVGWIERKIKMGVKLKGPCMLQEKIDMLCDYGVSGWMGPDGFLPGKFQIAFEHKKLLPGEIGPNTGEQGTLAQYVEKEKLADEMLKPLEPILKKLGHLGDFAVGVGIDKKGKAWPFEFTARIGLPIWFIQTASHFGDTAQWIKDLLGGKDTLKVSYDAAIGVVLAEPNYPYDYSPKDINTGNPIGGIDEVHEQMHLVSVMREKGPIWKEGKVLDEETYKSAGPYVMVATGLGKGIDAAQKRVYGAIEKIRLKDVMYRNEIGEKVKPLLKELKKHGYAESLNE